MSMQYLLQSVPGLDISGNLAYQSREYKVGDSGVFGMASVVVLVVFLCIIIMSSAKRRLVRNYYFYLHARVLTV